jgi:branched-chain amino acid transport system permease protein
MTKAHQDLPVESNGSVYRRFAPHAIGLFLFGVLPLFLPVYLQSLLTKVLIFSMFAMSLDILMGYTGLLSLGHAAYLGVSAYTVAILIKKVGITSFWVAAPAGILAAGLIAAVFGFIALRTSGIYFMLVTMALSMLLYSVAEKWDSVTNGTYGIMNIFRPDLGIPGLRWNDSKFYFFSLFFFVVAYYLMNRVVKSPFGLALVGIRESESRMQALGFNAWLYKYLAFIVSGVFAGMSGVLFVYNNGIVSPFHLDVTLSTMAMLICIVGGIGTLWGSLLGAALIVLAEFFSSIYFSERWPLILGVVFVAAVLFLQGGIALHLSKLSKRGPWKRSV